jgi:glycosyltransferase involved in cell wall biosynthesis
MRVAIVIPCHDTGRFLRESIESVLAQSRPPDEVIVVDDGSTDGSPEIAASFPAVKLLRQTQRGVSAARNRGIAEARSDAIVLHDADDRLLPRALEIGARALEARPECGFVYGVSRFIHADGSPVEGSARAPIADASYRRLLEGNALVPPSAAMFRKRALEAVGCFRVGQSLAEDYDLYLRVAQRFAIHCHGEPVVEWRRHGGNTSGSSPSRTLRALFATLDAQAPAVAGRPELEAAVATGRRHWSGVFGSGLSFEFLELLRRGRLLRAARAFQMVVRHHPAGLPEAARAYWKRS